MCIRGIKRVVSVGGLCWRLDSHCLKNESSEETRTETSNAETIVLLLNLKEYKQLSFCLSAGGLHLLANYLSSTVFEGQYCMLLSCCSVSVYVYAGGFNGASSLG